MTIKEVAKLAGVSPASVSRYLNDGPVSDSMRFKIRRVIEETGFQPNQYAQTMRSGRSRQILVIIPRLDSMSASQILNGVSERLIQSDYMLILGLTGGDHDKEAQYLKNLQSSMVDGIILMGTGMTKELRNCILAADRPVVVTGQNFSGIPCVYHDDYHAVKDLTGRALAGGRRHLAYLGVRREDLAAGEQRQMGAYDAIIEAGFDPNRCDWGTVEFSFESGELVMKQMLERSPEIDAVICATDTIALGAMKALRENGRRIPEDVVVGSIGDSWASQAAIPPLTSVHLNYKKCGMIAADMLLSRLGSKRGEISARQVMLDYSITERGSL